MGHAPLTTRNIRRAKGTDDVRSLKRRVAGAARLDLDVVHLRGVGPTLVRARRVKSASHARDLVRCLVKDEELDRAVLERNVELAAPPLPLDATLLATATHDLRVLALPPMLALAREHRRAFQRYGPVDAAWIAERRERLAELTAIPAPRLWTDTIVELIRSLRGEDEAAAIARAFSAFDAAPAERRDEAMRRVLAIASGDAEEPELVRLAERLEAARDFPGRARKRRMHDVLRQAIAWPLLPVELVSDDFVASATAALAVAPFEREEHLVARLALLALPFRAGDHGIPTLQGVEVDNVLQMVGADLTLAQACALSKHDVCASTRVKLAALVAHGLDMELVSAMVEKKLADELAELDDVRAARAYATWTIRLRDHERAHGVSFTLKPNLFEALPKNEDLAVLTMCLLDHTAKPGTDPLATLDSTLGLFRRLPTRARGILARLRGIEPGIGRRLEPAFAAWLDNDDVLDRTAHVAQLAGASVLTQTLREDFEHAMRRDGERAHLESLEARSEAQARRLESLRREERTLAGTPRERTVRRLRARAERLGPAAYARELDLTFRQILREGWGMEVTEITPAWRDAVRFWLVVDDNRWLLERLLRRAAKAPGASVVRQFHRSRRWLERHAGKVNVEAWLAPRRREITVKGARFVVELEEDPIEILRMGIPFGTCLALDEGSNAASTVLNAIEANKRVLYVRNESKSIVARKLLGLTNKPSLVGYRLYSAVGGVEQTAIAAAVTEMCEELARDVGVPLANAGKPEHLYHRDFWYDDGEVAFDQASATSPLPGYCASLGLSVPETPDSATIAFAERWHARETGDVTKAVGLVNDGTPEGRLHDAWTIERLGLRAALRRGAEEPSVAFALFDVLARDRDGMLRALDAAARLPERRSDHRLGPLLRGFPVSPKIGVALVDIALRGMRHSWVNDHGHAHLTLDELPRQLETVAGALDLFDGIEPAWDAFAERVPRCRSCVRDGIDASVDTFEQIFERAPDPDVVVAALMSRHRSRLAHRAVLRVAARHVLPQGARALSRFAVLRRDLIATGDGLAAFLRQAQIDAVTPAIAKRAPMPAASPFESLRELVALPGIELVLGAHTSGDGDAKGPWEHAWRRRRYGEPQIGHDAVSLDRARRVLLAEGSSDAERSAARGLVLASTDGGAGYWLRLVDACGRRGDAATAERILETRLRTEGFLPARVVVDLWTLDDEPLRAAIVAKLARQKPGDWCLRIRAAEREAEARGTSVEGLLVRVVAARVEAGAPAALTSLVTIAQVSAVIDALSVSASPHDFAALFVYLEDPLSLARYRRALHLLAPERRDAILAAIRKLDLTSRRAKTFFAWLTS